MSPGDTPMAPTHRADCETPAGRALSASKRARVVIVQPVVKQYRVPFFIQLAAILRQHGIELQVVYSDHRRDQLAWGDAAELSSELGWKVAGIWLVGHRLLYQAAYWQIRTADLVICEQASKHLLTYVLLLSRWLGWPPVAYWGHGRNWQAHSQTSVSERFKRRMLSSATWWFAYTQVVASYVESAGFPRTRITTVQNSTDVVTWRRALDRERVNTQQDLRARIGIAVGGPVGLYCGGLYSDKRLGFLIDAALKIRERWPEFQLIIVGDGPGRKDIRDRAASFPWILFAGAIFGDRRAPYFLVCDFVLCPGLVGLVVTDAMAAGRPVITTSDAMHSPEIEYIRDGITGVITGGTIDAYVAGVERLLTNRQLLTSMQAAAAAASEQYGVEQMAELFAAGVVACLQTS